MIGWFRDWQKRLKFKYGTRQSKWRLVGTILLSPFRWLGSAFSAIFRGLVAWWTSRQWRRLLWGLPAFFVACSCATVLLLAKGNTKVGLSQTYSAAGQSAVQRKDWKRALLFLERAVELGRRDNALMYDLAIAADALKDESRKIAVLRQLAPDTHAAYAPAHLWRATQLLSSDLISKEVAAQAERQLKFALSLDPDNPNANAFLGDLYFQAGIWKSAVDHLSKARQNGFKYRLMLSKATAAAGNVNNARSIAEDVLRTANEELQKQPSDLDARLAAGEAALLLERFSDAVRILEEGLRIHEQPVLHQSLALVLIHWSDDMLRKSPDNRPQAFRLLASAIEQNPSEFVLFDRILKLLRAEDQTAAEAESFLQENLIKGNAPGLSHLILGTAAFEEGNTAEAGAHLEQAFRLLPNGTIVANNFAWFLLHSDPLMSLVRVK